MAGIPKKEARVSEITDGWQTAFEPVFALAVTQPAPEESAAAAKSAWQAVDMSWPEALVDYSSLKTAKMMEICDGDIESAKRRLAALIREVNKCITLLSGK